MYAMYNDQPPEGHTSLNHGHTKGKETAQNHWRTPQKLCRHHNHWRTTQKLCRHVKYIKWSVITTAGDCYHKKDIHTTSMILVHVILSVKTNTDVQHIVCQPLRCITDDEEHKTWTIITTTDVLHRNRTFFIATDAQHRYCTVIKLN